MSHLVPCFACQRHVSVSDERCPFCGLALSPEQRASAAPELPRRRMGRAALFTFGATLLGGTACDDGSRAGTDAGSDARPADGAAGTGGSGSGGHGGQTGSGGSGTGGSASGGSGTGGRAGTGGSASGGSGTGGRAGTGGSASGGSGTGGRAGTGGAGTGGIAPPYGIGPAYGVPASDE